MRRVDPSRKLPAGTRAPVNVKMMDYVAAYRRDREAIDRAVRDALESGQPLMGAPVRAFEEAFAAYCGVRFAAGVKSGSSALLLAIRALGIGTGDQVITVANSDIPTSLAITHAGAEVVWVDIDPNTMTMDPDAVEAAITPRTRALLPVHLYGVPAQMDRILAIAARYGLAVVEDACLATGATYRGRRVGSLGTLGAFSTAPGKVLWGLDGGGVIVTDDPALFERLNFLRFYGRARSPYPDDASPGPRWPVPTVLPGYNERLGTMDGAVLSIRLRQLDADLDHRRAIALAYERAFAGTPVKTQQVPDGAVPVWQVYTVRLSNRDCIFAELHERGVEAALRYLPPNHLDECYGYRGYVEGQLPHTEAAAREILSLPVHPFMTPADAQEVAGAVLDLLAVGPARATSEPEVATG